jgi:hypothetical protein
MNYGTLVHPEIILKENMIIEVISLTIDQI